MTLFSRDSLRPLCLIFISLFCLFFAQGGNASPAGDAIKQLSARYEIDGEVRLSDLGFTDPIILYGANAHREFYIPVSEGIDLTNAFIDFHAVYRKPDDTPSGVVFSVDGAPQVLEMSRATKIDMRRTLPVAPGVRKSGFVRLDIDVESLAAKRPTNGHPLTPSLRCKKLPIDENQLSIGANTTLRYRYDTRSISTVKQAWEMLPREPTLLVAGKSISKDGFDTAWRVGTSLHHLGRRARLISFPAVGDAVDVKTLSVPAALTNIPAYASLIGKKPIRLSAAAQAGALLTLSAPAIDADIIIVDSRLRQQINESLDALRSQLVSDADAVHAFDVWRSQRISLAAKSDVAGVALGVFAGRSLITVQAGEGKEVSGIFDKTLQPLLTSAQRKAIGTPLADASTSDRVDILPWGPASSTFDVIDKGQWTANIPLPTLSSDGRMATEISVEVTAMPDPSGTRPVLTLFWNDILLNAKQLRTQQQPETLMAHVPAYAMGLNNEVRISVQRDQEPKLGDCKISENYPVTVLAPSHITKGSPDPNGTFQGLLPLLAGAPQLFVPASDLRTPAVSLQTVISLAASTGLSVTKTTLVITADDQFIKPKSPFLAVGTKIRGVDHDISVNKAHQIQVRGRRADWLSETKPDGLSVAQVVRSHNQDGIIWYALDTKPAHVDRSFALTTGTAVLLGSSGPVSWLNDDRPAISTRGPHDAAYYQWPKPLSWGAPLIMGLILAFVILLVLAAYHRRKNHKEH